MVVSFFLFFYRNLDCYGILDVVVLQKLIFSHFPLKSPQTYL